MLYTVEGWMLEVRRLLPLPVLSLPVARQPACTISRMPGHFLLAFPVCPGLFCLSYPPLCPVPPFLLHALPTFDLSWVQIQKEVISDLKSERKILFKSWQSTLCRKSKRILFTDEWILPPTNAGWISPEFVLTSLSTVKKTNSLLDHQGTRIYQESIDFFTLLETVLCERV